MNIFFGINHSLIKSKITIPKFKNQSSSKKDIKLFEISIENNNWIIKELKSADQNEDYFFINNKLISNNNLFILANEKEIENFNNNELNKFNNFTDTVPAFRCNLEIYLENGGFSSYQSEYPFDMTKKNGNIASSVHSLTNKDAEQNFLLFRNIYFKPVYEKFYLFFVDLKTEKIVEHKEILTNNSNLIKLESYLIKPEIFILTNKYIGIPIFISIDNLHLSCEHTHPPHEYILSKNKFKNVSNFKKKLYEIAKKNFPI